MRNRLIAAFATGTATLLAAGTSFSASTSVEGWASFRSSAGFSVLYPVDWVRKDAPKDQLFILSSEGGAGPAVIRPGQALLSVVEAQERMTLQALRDDYTKGIVILARRHIHNERAGPEACRDLYEVVSKEPAVPPGTRPAPGPGFPEIINTEFFCQIGPRKYVTVLRNFEGDRKQAGYQEVAVRVARSLRFAKPSAD